MPRPRRSRTNGHARPNGLCIHIITYGNSRGRPPIPMPKLMHLDCSRAQAPPEHLQLNHTGADREVFDYFFSNPVHERIFQKALDHLEVMILNGPYQRGGCAAVVLNCVAGKHRSVAMAERLADEIEQWDRVVVQREHLDTDVESGLRRRPRIEAGTHR